MHPIAWTQNIQIQNIQIEYREKICRYNYRNKLINTKAGTFNISFLVIDAQTDKRFEKI